MGVGRLVLSSPLYNNNNLLLLVFYLATFIDHARGACQKAAVFIIVSV
jgi:hypothetical protein